VNACQRVSVDPKLGRQLIPESPSDSTELGILREAFPIWMRRPYVFRNVDLTSAKDRRYHSLSCRSGLLEIGDLPPVNSRVVAILALVFV
jgi:hypothetical protein